MVNKGRTQICAFGVCRSLRVNGQAPFATVAVLTPAVRASASLAPLMSLLVAVTTKHPELMGTVVIPLLIGGGLIFNGLQMFKKAQMNAQMQL
ncbi:hypothetical protein NDN08_008223 [Rhodosorus marinus]|uniref:Sugar phosphate transporter domain-containing protein n=1 Tax=Rhodosorus marinus TaxID=101924 RepID=A0AAV8V2L8_9RHOD|nr:hypothetical protein NDN08_008223 [Rhodosorus marinus]